MIIRSYRPASAISLIALLISFWSLAEAQPLQPQSESEKDPTNQDCIYPTGIIADRISTKDIQQWNVMKQTVFARDTKGFPLHPVLRSLWKQLEKSGHTIYIELRGRTRPLSSTAGSFHIERFDPAGQRHVAVVRIYPNNIDQAYVGSEVSRSNGLTSFVGLSKEDRYVEVLGHELAHALWILGDLNRSKMAEELIEQTNQLLLSRPERDGGGILKAEMEHRLIKRDFFLAELEERAEAAELVVWQELVRSRWLRNKSR